MASTAKQALLLLLTRRDKGRAAALARYFKTGKGEYAEGDRFIGLTVPMVRQIARQVELPLREIEKLLGSPWHEGRLLALIVMTDAFERGDPAQRREIYESYLSHTRSINNWDLVDGSAPLIVGSTLFAYRRKERRAVLDRLAASKSVWERRIAVLATFHFIQKGDSTESLRLAKKLLRDPHDLMHKALGWMLREIGKRVSREELVAFLKVHAGVLPRTTLRYAIEHFSPEDRARYLAMQIRRRS